MTKKGSIDTALSDQQIVRELQRTVERNTKNRKIRNFFSTIIVIAALFVVITGIWFPIYHVQDQSLEPMLRQGQLVLTSRAKNFKQEEIAAVKDGNDISFRYIMAIPGDKIDLNEKGELLINNKSYGEIFLDEANFATENIMYPCQLPENSYLTIENFSAKSDVMEVPTLTYTDTDSIAAKVLFCIWPFFQAGYIGS